MSSRKVKAIIGILAVAVLVMLAAAHSRKSNYSIVIPKVLTYPTTTLTFASRSAILGAPSVAADKVQVKFDNPNWAATVSEAHLVTKAGGTYFKLSCQASSTPCLEATRGSGSYTYSLVPSSLPAPAEKGTYALVWDVNPPGDTIQDVLVVPEPNTQRTPSGTESCLARERSIRPLRRGLRGDRRWRTSVALARLLSQRG
jgi:hypothetical protein